jgi:methylated-DNA-[protein]-cysteine S-methyltransferase
MESSMITIDTPVGPLTVAGDGEHVTFAGFGPADRPVGRDTSGGVPDGVAEAVRSYFDGRPDALDAVPLAHHGTPYQLHGWRLLRTVRTPLTYTDFAALLGRPAAIRAAASVCARNEIALFTPCHRVLRTDGSLGGYRWGLDVKRALLRHEEATSPAISY